MKNSSSIVFFLLCFSLQLIAQDNGLLKAEGKIPKEFITPSTVKYKKQVTSLNDKKTKRKKQKEQKQFLLESGFSIDDILQSGMVLFNDPASDYVNKVLAKLPFGSEKKLTKKKPRAYILNSSAVNAFATDQGIIFVTLGLLANLENEAQLAFILSHELIHIKHQHAINKFIKAKDIDRKGRRGNTRKIGVDRGVFKKSMYSRQLEEEADDEGLDIFLKSDYDPQAILNTFKILHYSYLPFDEVPFEKDFFEDKDYILDESLWLKEVKAVSPMDEENEEEESSHPSSIKRMKKLTSSIPGENSDKKVFLISEEEFNDIRNRARNQIPYLNLYAENFPQSIYTSFLLLRNDPENINLQKVIAKSLYMESKYRNYYDRNDSSWEYKEMMEEIVGKVEGESQRVYHLLSELEEKELSVLTLKYNWKVYRQNPEDPEMKMIIDDVFVEFNSHFDDLNSFSKTAIAAKPIEEKPQKSEAEKTKLEKIETISDSEKNYWKYAFVEEMKNEDFLTAYKEGKKKFDDKAKKADYYDSRDGRRELNKEYSKEQKKGKQLGIKKVVVVNPFYLSLNQNKENSVQYIRSEKKQEYFRKTIKELSEKSKTKAVILDVNDLAAKDIEKFNDISEVNDYFSQQMDHFDLSLSPGYNQNEVNAIADKYGTDYFLWTGVISLKEKNNYLAYIGFSIIMPWVLPYTIPKMIKQEYDMLYYAILFDVKTGRRSIIKMDYFDKRDSKTILKAHIYDVFHQIGTREKG
ncbi:MAG: M48 family metallopeptidase [Saprospiraceae bacterium]